MKTVTVNKNALRTTLLENRTTHQDDFELAWEGFKKRAVSELEAYLAVTKRRTPNDNVNDFISFDPPVNHTEDYDRAIEMLDWELSDEVELTEQEFRQLVQDSWAWKQQFTHSNVLYTGSASPSKG